VRQSNVAKEKSASRENWIIEPDLEENIALAVNWLRTDAKIATEGVDGDHKAYATAAHLHSFGISRELAGDLMWEHWNPRCNPPWTSEEADHFDTKIKNGYQYHTSDPGNITPAYKVAKEQELKDKFKPVISREDDGSFTLVGSRFRIVNRKGMNKIKPVTWLIPDFMQANSYMLLFGARGTMKTFVAIDIAMSIAMGIDLDQKRLWWDTTECGPVLFAAGEGRSGFTKRVRLWEQVYNDGEEVDNFYLIDPVPNIDVDQVDEFIEHALEALPVGETYKLVVLDTVGRAMQGRNENAQENASMFTKMVEQIQKRLGCAVLAVHHTGKQDGTTARGSSVFEADVDTLVRVDRPTKAYNLELVMTKQKEAPEWEEPLPIKIIETDMGPEEKSLTVHAMPPEEIKEQVPKDDNDRKRRSPQDQLRDKVIWQTMAKLFGNFKGKTWTTSALADELATIKAVSKMNIGSESLRKKNYLIRYREKDYSEVKHFYDGATKTWRYAKTPTPEGESK
jgi:RecA-family ATPase